MPNKLTRAVIIALAVILGGCATPVFLTPASVENLDSNLQAIDSLYTRLQKVPPYDFKTLEFLSRNVEQLPTLFRYEYARLLNSAGRRPEAIVQVVRARLAREIDIAECARVDNSTRVPTLGFLTDATENAILNKPARVDDQTWYAAIAGAFEWEASRAHRASSLWVCGTGNTKDFSQASADRNARRQALKVDFENMVASSGKQKPR